MPFKEDAKYFGLDANPKTVEEALQALKKIRNVSEAYKPHVASAVLDFYSVITDKIGFCDYKQYLTGEVYHKMAALAGSQPEKYVNSPGYTNAFSTAIDLMINKSAFYFKHKEKFDSGMSYQKIQEAL